MVNRIEQIISLIKSGKNFSQIARELNCSRNTVKTYFWNHTKTHYVLIPKLWGLTEKDIDNIVLRKKYGDDVKDIANDFNVSKSYIYKLIKKWS